MKHLQAIVPLFVFWVLLSSGLDPVELAVGLLLSIAIAIALDRLVWRREQTPALSLRQMGAFAAYVPYLVKEIVKANVYVAEKVLDPRMPIDPVMVEFESTLERPVARVALANSITLTPGTLTVDVDDTTFVVHCLGSEFRGGIAERTLEHRVARVFEGG